MEEPHPRVRGAAEDELRHLDAIVATAENGLANARAESANSKIKAIVGMAYGFRSLDSLFAMVMLRCSGLEVPLPGRS